MAAPVKAYIDPTYMSKMLPTWTCWSQGISMFFDAMPMVPTHIVEDTRLPWSVLQTGIPRTVFMKVPTPPMGRLTGMTFPAVYKEREARPNDGQVWPRFSRKPL